MSSGAESRAAAARCITRVMEGHTLEQALAEQLDSVAERDRALLREMCSGTLRAYPRLEALLNQLLSRPLRKRDLELKALALLGLYQLSAMRVPDHAAVSATVDATAQIQRKSARGLINAVLRRYLREREALHGKLSPAASAALPAWLWDALASYGSEQREAIARACDSRPPLTLRVNRRRGTRADYLQLLADAGLAARAGSLADDALTLEEGLDVEAIPGFRDGVVSVQDEAAQLAATLLAPRPGERVLDACAAPGGKSGHLLEIEPQIELLACDSNAQRLSRVADNAARLGVHIATAHADLRDPPPAVSGVGPFDAILLDVPCSATGVIRRHPDIKLLRRESDVAGFAAQQATLLEGCWSLLQAGGRLLYVTCSILREENSAVVEQFLASHSDAREKTPSLPAGERAAVGWQLLPCADGSDGLYFALLLKQA